MDKKDTILKIEVIQLDGIVRRDDTNLKCKFLIGYHLEEEGRKTRSIWRDDVLAGMRKRDLIGVDWKQSIIWKKENRIFGLRISVDYEENSIK